MVAPQRLARLADRLDDEQLVERARGGQVDVAKAAKRALFERHVGMASAVALRLLGADDDLEDVVQDSFVAAYNGLQGLSQPAAFGGWLASIVTRTAIATLRRRRLRRRLGFRTAEPVDLDRLVGASTPPDVAAELRAVYGVVTRLPAEERVMLVLRRLERLSLPEIATQTGYSLATVKRRLARAESVFLRALSTPEGSRRQQ